MEITVITPDMERIAPLYNQYQGQTTSQPAYIELDPEAKTLCANWSGEIGNAIPMAVYHSRLFRWTIAASMSAAAIGELLRETMPLAERVCAGYACEWDGNNHKGRLNPDAGVAEDEMQELCDSYSHDEDNLDTVIDVEDWLIDFDRDEIGAETDDATIAQKAHEIEEFASEDRILVIGDVEEYLLAIRQEKRDEAE
jgi:hypothetical protein